MLILIQYMSRLFLHMYIDFIFYGKMISTLVYSPVRSPSSRVVSIKNTRNLADFCFLLGKPVHTVQLLLAERMYKLQDSSETIEFYGPPHPEDPQGEFIDERNWMLDLFFGKVQHFGHDRISIVDDRING